MFTDIPVNLLTLSRFLTENKQTIFFSALSISILGGIFVAWSDVVKRIFVFSFILAIVFPTQDIQYFFDIDYLGDPSSRGLCFMLADLFLLSLILGTLLGGGRRRPKLWVRGATPYMVYIAVAALSLTNMLSYPPAGFLNPAYAYGVFELLNIIKGFLVFWVMVNFIQGGKEIRLMLIAMILIIVIQVLSALYQQYIVHNYVRTRGTVGHPNSLAMFMGMIMPVILVFMLSQKRGGILPWILAVLFIGSVGVMVKTVSRAGLAAMVISLTIAAAMLLFNVRRLHAGRIAALVLIIGIGGAIIGYRYWDRMMARFTTESEEAEASTQRRFKLLEYGWEIAQKNIIIGSGANSFPIEITIEPRYANNRSEQHNLYLLTLCEVGILGLGAFLFTIGRILQMAWRLYRQNINPPLKILSIGLACGMLHVLIQSFFEFIFRAVFISYMFWTFAGMIVASTYILEAQMTKIQYARLALARRMAAARQETAQSVPDQAVGSRY